MARLAYASIGVIALSLLVLAFSPSVSAQGLILEEIGDHEQTCEASSSVEYEWFVYNGYNTSYLLELSTNLSSGDGWSSEFEQQFLLLTPGEGASVKLVVSATSDVTSIDANQTVFFTFTGLEDSADSEVLTGYADTKMIPVWGIIAPGKNKLLGLFDNPLPEPLNDNYATFLINVGLWGVIALVFMYVVDPIVGLFTKKTKTDVDDRILAVVRKPIFILVVIYGLVSSFSILPLSEKDIGSVFRLYGITLIAIVTFVAYKIFKEVLVYMGRKWSAKTDTEIDDVLIPVIDKIGGILILIFGAMSVITYLGYDITFLLAGVGVFGLVIAFAAQDALSNFFSGIALLLDRPFSEGDYVTISTGELCRVDKIGIRSTRLLDVFVNDYIVLPNNKLINDKIVNLTQPNEQTVTNVVVGIAYGSDVKKVEKILLEAANKHENVLKEVGKVPVVRFTNFGESALEFKVIVWVDHFMNQWKVAHDLRMDIHKRFAEEGIETPFPQRTIYIKEMPKQK
jgi:small-conductance mechanosensitive channel